MAINTDKTAQRKIITIYLVISRCFWESRKLSSFISSARFQCISSQIFHNEPIHIVEQATKENGHSEGIKMS